VHLHIIYHIIYVKYFVVMVFDWHTTPVPVAYGRIIHVQSSCHSHDETRVGRQWRGYSYRYVILSQTTLRENDHFLSILIRAVNW